MRSSAAIVAATPSSREVPASRDGSVLIVVLWVCVGLVSVTLLFGHSMLMSFRGADNDLAGRQAEQAIEGVVRYIETLLVNAATPGLVPDTTTYQADALPVGEATVWFLGRAEAADNGRTPVFGLIDEASKLNLNKATPAMLQQLPGMTEELAAAIQDWRDADDDVTSNGAESETYLQRRPAYSCKNADFETVEELALVNGADATILYGEDANMNGALDANEDDGDRSAPADNSDGKLDPGVLEYLTVFSREPNTQADGSARINVATLTNEVRTLLDNSFPPDRAATMKQRLGTGGPIRSPLEFYVRSGMTADEFDTISDKVTTSPDETLVGLVNVNTAAEAVLACIPGIGTDKAAALVAARLSRATTQSTSIAWVAETLAEGVPEAGPFLTGRTLQIGADVAAVGRHGRGYRRMKFVIDMSTGTPRIVYRRNLASFGWALGNEVRDTFATTESTP